MDTQPVSAELQTREHVMRVQEILSGFAVKIIERSVKHDRSKFTPQEMGPLQAELDHQAIHGRSAYGTPEYEQARERLAPMLEHHYRNNDHHPEHYEDEGILGMDLFALIEMVADWQAASERGGEAHVNLTASVERFDIPQGLTNAIENTLRSQNIPYK